MASVLGLVELEDDCNPRGVDGSRGTGRCGNGNGCLGIVCDGSGVRDVCWFLALFVMVLMLMVVVVTYHPCHPSAPHGFHRGNVSTEASGGVDGGADTDNNVGDGGVSGDSGDDGILDGMLSVAGDGGASSWGCWACWHKFNK